MRTLTEILAALARRIGDMLAGLFGFTMRTLGLTAGSVVDGVAQGIAGTDATHQAAANVEGATAGMEAELARHAAFAATAPTAPPLASATADPEIPSPLDRVPDTGAMPVPRVHVTERYLPSVIHPDREPERWLLQRLLQHTTHLQFGTGSPVDLSVFGPKLRRRLERLDANSAAPVHREAIALLGYGDIVGWWWPHLERQPAPSYVDQLEAEWGHGVTVH